MSIEQANGSPEWPDIDSPFADRRSADVIRLPFVGAIDRREEFTDAPVQLLPGLLNEVDPNDLIDTYFTEDCLPHSPVVLRAIKEEARPSRELFQRYVDSRETVKLQPRIEGRELTAIQESVRGWLLDHPDFTSGQDYQNYDQHHITQKLYGLTQYLRENHGDKVNEIELAATELFVSAAYSMYEDRETNGTVSPDADGSFAFVVPARMSRTNKDYGQEVEPVIPALRYVPNELRAQLMVGLPPFIIDTYKPDATGKRGYLVLAPIYGDMMEDMYADGASDREVLAAARQQVDAAVDFAQQRLGVTVAGLGAIIPSLTNFGKAVSNQNILITNGHGGTAYLVKETAQAAIAEGLVGNKEHPHIGVLGLGAIGASIANLAAEEFDPPIEIYDTNESKRVRTQQNIEARGGEAVQSSSEEDLVYKSDVIISAIVGRIGLSDFIEKPDLTGKVVVDDSQPGSFDPREVQEHGGRVVWVIARDQNGAIQRDGYDYGTMVDEKSDLFGCEAEAGVLYQYSQELQARGVSSAVAQKILRKVAVKEAVTPQKARLIGALFKKYGVVPSEFQAFGQPIDL